MQNSFSSFFDDLASDKSSPGGGSVAALTGAQSVSLVLMVARLTIGKKKYAAVENEIKEIINQGSSLKDSLLKKVEEDILIFQKIMAAYSLPKDQRDDPLQEALSKSALFSFSMIEEAFAILKLAHKIAEIGNRNLISDAAIAVLLAMTCIESSIVNVNINLKPLKDKSLINTMTAKMQTILGQAKQIKQQALQITDQYLSLG